MNTNDLTYDELMKDEDPKDFIMPYGKYKGLSIDEIYTKDQGEYLQWIADTFDPCDIKTKVVKYLRVS